MTQSYTPIALSIFCASISVPCIAAHNHGHHEHAIPALHLESGAHVPSQPDMIHDTNQQAATTQSDPLAGYNRWMFNVNSSLDRRIAQPVAKGYKRVTPKPVRAGIGNFFHNIGEPWNAVNLMLQGKPGASFKSLGRFTINTVSTLGLGDPAGSAFDLSTTREDFGQTLGTWGIPSGPYVVLPVLGPSTLRDVGGRAVDMQANPISYSDSAAVSAGAAALYGIDKRAKLLTFEGIVDSSNYTLVRDVFLEKREFDVQESGSANTQTSDDSFDDSFGD